MCQAFGFIRIYWNAIVEWCEFVHSEIQTYLADVLEHLLLLCFVYLITCIVLYFSILKWKVLKFQKGINGAKRVLLVTAHPDDESMFFGPTIMQLAQQENVIIYLMCLSTGDNMGFGKIRKKELYNACKLLGIKDECITIQNHTQLPDAMDVKWPIEIISQLILQHIESYDIDTLITFDKEGVSKHVNHCSIYYAIANLSTTKKLPKSCLVYVLESTNIIRKYWLLLDIPLCYIFSRVRFFIDSDKRTMLCSAMQQHKSQYVWFRKLYFMFSRYTMLNTFQRMDVVDIELDLVSDE